MIDAEERLTDVAAARPAGGPSHEDHPSAPRPGARTDHDPTEAIVPTTVRDHRALAGSRRSHPTDVIDLDEGRWASRARRTATRPSA